MVGTAQVLYEELTALRPNDVPPEPPPLEAIQRHAAGLNLSALCLSGGGIRNAAFSLGVLQALARARLLDRFDYLSTVSGGGYIGSWLQSLMHHHPGGAAGAIEEIAERAAPSRAIARLRQYTNFLTPNPGPTFTDMWTAVVLYIRNLLLNWLVFLPLLLAGTIVPILCRTFVWASQDYASMRLLFLVASIVLAGWITAAAALALPTHRRLGTSTSTGSAAPAPATDYCRADCIRTRIELPFVAWMILFPWSQTLRPGADASPLGPGDVPGEVPYAVLGYALALLAGYGIAWWLQWRRQETHVRLFWLNLPQWLIATAVSAGMIWLGIHWLHAYAATCFWVQPGPDACGKPIATAALLVIFGPLWCVMANTLHSALFAALRRVGDVFDPARDPRPGGRLADLDREWLARLNAVKLRWPVLWAVFAFVTLALPDILLALFDTSQREVWMSLIAPLTGAPVVAWLGKRVATPVGSYLATQAKASGAWTGLMLQAASLVVISALLAALSFLMQRVIMGGLQGWIASIVQPRDGTLWDTCPLLLLLVHIAIAVVIGLCVLYVDRRVNVNRVSMHGLYRNRLARAFLGSARPDRQPDPFCDLDPFDNVPLSRLRREPAGRTPLYPVINMALNLTATSRTEWAERQAMSFVMTPTVCGSAQLPAPVPPWDVPAGAFVPTAAYAGWESAAEARAAAKAAGTQPAGAGISLATAMAISGAAASPNWGYHSSPVTAFVMTLFNVRLGAWLPNPAKVTDPVRLSQARPDSAARAMLGDLLGITDDASPSVYLTDGGHFENLAAYEMLRRRCRIIVLVDGGQDGGCDYEDLGNLIRKARIDQNVAIDFPGPMLIHGDATKPAAAGTLGFAVATIRYPEFEEPTGRLIYIKPSMLPVMPADARAYANANPAFPHETTADQWFSESQFESYRRLGQWQAERAIGGAETLDALVTAARDASGSPLTA